ncbi:MAG TPA: hypothetical protein ENL27_02725 [Candidatus Parcubacteria bacterium]|nr:hypothetical protein [Candidatus Parcubacteria bacterium]
MKAKKIEAISLYDQGTDDRQEDRAVVCNPVYGVLDGMSGMHLPGENPTEGERAVKIVLEELSSMGSLSRLWEANQIIRLLSKEDNPAYKPAVYFALGEITDDSIEIVQSGDCMVLWEMKGGKVGATPNQVFEYEKKLREIISRLMERYNGNPEKMWEAFVPILAKKRERNINTTFGALNGDPRCFRFFNRFSLPLESLKTVIFITDGMVDWKKTAPGEEQSLAREIISLFHQGGLEAILDKRRKEEEKEKRHSHVANAEASGVAVTFLR